MMQLRQIGVVRSEFGERKKMPPLGAPGGIELLPEFADGLLQFEKHSHIWVLAWLDRAERDLLQVMPRGGTEIHGVFAVRSPVRPNPLGLTACQVTGVEGTRISVHRIDFLDGTPVVDIKPYFVTRDAILSANNAPIGKPMSVEALHESLLLQAANFHGELCDDLRRAVEIIRDFRIEILSCADLPHWDVTVPLRRPCVVDAVMGMTRATLGRGNLQFHNAESIVIRHNGVSREFKLSS